MLINKEKACRLTAEYADIWYFHQEQEKVARAFFRGFSQVSKFYRQLYGRGIAGKSIIVLLPEKYTAGPLFYTHSYGEGDVLHLAGLTIDVIHTPGHTPGCVCYQFENALFTGDTLFNHGYGRTDLMGGNFRELVASLRRLYRMDEALPFFPGHGPSSTIGKERGR